MMTSDELVTALAEAQEAHHAWRVATQHLATVAGTPAQDRALKVVQICARERDRANARFVELKHPSGA